MIELPEALTIAAQMGQTLAGKTIESFVRDHSPHKFAFYSGTVDEYREILVGATLGRPWVHGSCILQAVGDEHVIMLGEGGERIRFHESEKTVPKKHQMLLRFTDDTLLSVTISGWGSARVLRQDKVADLSYYDSDKLSPLDDRFDEDHLLGLFAGLDASYNKPIKFFVISEPGILGIGNGYLQDILFYSGIHPRRKVADVSLDEQPALYMALKDTLPKAVSLGGRATEYDIFDRRGGYERLMDSKTKGEPCPSCGTAIEKISLLGGSCYLCPRCQI